MSGNVEPKGYKENPVLLPMPPEKRLYGVRSFSWMMFGLNVCIPMFFLGVIGLDLGLTPAQVAVGALIGNFAAVIVLWLNGIVGVKYGIPYPVHLRPSWGFSGSQIAVILRGIVGFGWYGIEAYNGSLAIIMILLYAIGYGGRNPELVADGSYKWVGIIVLPYVALATYVMWKGLKAIARFVDIAGPLIVLYFLWLLYYLSGKTPVGQPAAGVPYYSMPFAIYLAVQTNWWATVALNISDLSRGLYADKRGVYGLIIGPILGIIVGQIVGSLLGYYLAVYTGKVTPQEIILYGAPGWVAMLLGEIFAFAAPFSTDITANIPAAINILTSTLKLPIKLAAIGSGIIGFFLAPWWAVSSGPGIVNYVTAFASNYGIILGPIGGIMVADYYIIRKRNYDLQKLYTKGPDGYWFHGGYNLSAIVSYILTIAIVYGFSAAIHQISWTGPIPWPTNLSWYFGVVINFVLYLVFVKIFKEDKP